MINPFKPRSKLASMFQFVVGNPGTTAADLAAKFEMSRGGAAAALSYMYKQGAVQRVVAGHTVSNVPIYSYVITPHKVETPTSENVSRDSGNVARKRKVKHVSAPTPTSSLDQLVDQVAAQFAHAIIGKVKARLLTELEALVPSLPHEPVTDVSKYLERISTQAEVIDTDDVVSKLQEPAPTAVVHRKPRVCVVGLKPNQAGEITAEFHDCLDLSFWCSTDNSGFHSLEAMARHSDVVFLHTRHSSHAIDSFLVSCGAKLRRIPGGVSQLKEAMLKYFAEA